MTREFMLHYDIHFYAIFLLLVMVPIIMRNNGKNDMRIRLFLILIYSTITVIFLEFLTNVSDGQSGTLAYIVNYSSNSLLLLGALLIGAIWANYVDYTIFESKENLRRNHYYLHAPAIIALLLIVNIFIPIFFNIDQNNLFHKGPLHSLILGALLAIYFYVYLLVQKHREQLKSSVVWGVLLFVMFPSLFEASEYILGELPYTFVSIAFSIIFVYLFTESVSNTRDKTTDLFTRQKATDYIQNAIKKNEKFSVVVIDLDSFKEINDTLGHMTGDRALIDFTKKLSSIFKFDSMVSRMGGDEFIVISRVIDQNEIKERMEFLQYKVLSSEQDYAKYLNFSYGCALSMDAEKLTVDHIIHMADMKMYQAKESKKRI